MSTLSPSSWRALAGIALVAVLLFAVAPATLSPFRLDLLAKYLCWAIVAVGIGLAWGRGGMLVLGQGLFFGLGAYAMAFHLKLEQAGPGGVPDFMGLYAGGQMPAWWEPFRSGAFTLLVIAVVPPLVAALVGYAVLKRRVKGAYFAILSQALAAAFAILLIGQIKVTGGFNGLNNFTTFFGYNLFLPENRLMLFQICAGILVAALALMALLYTSRFGELLVAARDAEERVRFLGTDPANVKLVAFVIAAFLAGIGGAMFVPVVGIVSPSNVDAVASIGLVAGAALGGRAALFGPAVGAVAVGYAQSSLSETFPGMWSYFQGGLFVLIILLLPSGLASVVPKLAGLRRRRPARVTTELEVAA
ncbi:urea ABC transporter permease subunit UrtC [Aeromicrobium flavum]|uniref:urea ABC transporter permease subunit UrtC n=1 Tax=Aeromicrobium flavum TaxID=416568 RepID=UPI0031D4BA9F